ncbi:hypothetical protein LMG28727_06311 [Paraburkholderia kirstenboschensis]|uniref:DUF1045 domain-containing protein n=1 Tax=Paraburkholderia kirstenboschensis TaxID=1245436 RepID=UPI000AB123A3|nr:DUF1045 domain-containing protein [Paraburkholderia kirstenboschensis]CAD6557212.1 hypothetical protein LMG28727_06311 [Paraburkholderia kirstenboschensis]
MSAWTHDARIALYYAPPLSSAWWQAGSEWLGRDAESGESVEPPPVPALAQPIASLTVAPRRYGWHGTLVPPFHIAAGCTREHVVSAAKAWAKKISPFNVPMQAAELDRFVALRAAQPDHDEVIGDIAANALHALASLRARPSSEDTGRRLAPTLNPRQRALLHEWGYPYVLDEFRFHMTLSDSIDSAPLRAAIRTLWQARSESLGPLPFHGAALFVQHDRAAPFSLWQRLPFGDAGESA